MKELQPINQYVLIEKIEEETKKTSSGIIIPETAKKEQNTGKVLAIAKVDNAEISVGDIVIFKKYSGEEIEFEGKEFLLIPYSDIIAKIVETEEL